MIHIALDGKKSRTWETPRPAWNAIKHHVLENRDDPTEAEERLWKELRKLKAKGFHFRRQHAIGRFIVDFYCWKLKLAVEVDGPIHEQQRAADVDRDRWLNGKGVRILRFSNDQVLSELESVVSSILIEARRHA